MPTISATSYDRFLTCPRLYFFEYVVGFVRAREDGARRFGAMFHAGLEAWWRAMDGGDVPWRDADAALVDALRAIADNARHIDTDPYERARAEAMMVAYHAAYYELEFESVFSSEQSVEVWFRMPLIDERGKTVPGWTLTGRKDAVKRFADLRAKPVEHKTTASDIDLGADLWARLKVAAQGPIYVDAVRFMGVDAREVLYDVCRKPALRPQLATPEDKRRYTKGKGCPHCGGRRGGKLGVAPGTGKIMVRTKVDADGLPLPDWTDVEVTCTSCDGTGWQEPPALDARQRTDDESPDDFKMRVAEELRSDFNAYLRQGVVRFDDDQLAEARADLTIVSGQIGALSQLSATHGLASIEARRCWPRNGQACTNVYGRRCDFLDVCSGAVDPWRSHLYVISPRRTRARIECLDERGHVTSVVEGTVQP